MEKRVAWLGSPEQLESILALKQSIREAIENREKPAPRYKNYTFELIPHEPTDDEFYHGIDEWIGKTPALCIQSFPEDIQRVTGLTFAIWIHHHLKKHPERTAPNLRIEHIDTPKKWEFHIESEDGAYHRVFKVSEV